MHATSRRRWLIRSAALALLTASLPIAGAHAAEAFPTKPITMVVGFAAGGSADILARLLGESMGKTLGQPIVIDNRPGAGGTIANSFVAGAPADGHTLLFVTSGFPGAAALYPRLKYDNQKSFAPVALVGQSPVVVVVPASSPVRDFKSLLEAARKAPGKINYSAGGGGATTTALAAEFLKNDAKVDMQMIPYKGSGPALTALLSGEVDAGFDIPSSALPYIQAGKLRALAVTTAQRAPVLPEVPTVAELAVPRFEVTGWFGVLAPAGTPPAVVQRLHKEVNAALRQSAVAERLKSLGVEPGKASSADFAQLIGTETQRYGEAIRRLGLTPD
ncbi:tripartite tricarboxylate transporter substrate binding protein [Xenophilus arseniciresistens]|uniref:Tripartite tricarboxylate transporter substrate binding protein n=1 Tax=Xenophilus arseniciresistens TaxID=1283306 RepID=A0AAE3N8P9_9BURK|nr:tripartite tricarboxylate transporter substrate binding protein [Xenophilus arseniciresistens]MDA7416988.1 tripartite tricarboxylate transporter substrate binding protein [Xenophilus arseniciresistens]